MNRLFANHLARRFVLAQRDEARMAEDSVGGELGEGDFGDQFGLQPMRAPLLAARHFERRFVDFERDHSLPEAFDHFGVEAGSDLAGVGELALVADPEQQRAEAAALVAFRPADKDELLPLDAFDLEPVAGPCSAIGSIGALRDDPLAALVADRVEQSLALADDMVAVDDR